MDLNERQIHRTREGEMGEFLKSSGMCKKVYMDSTSLWTSLWGVKTLYKAVTERS